MDSYIIILIIFIIILVFYLVYKNIQEYKILEKFSNNSLSTYFQNTTDYDSYMKNNNIFDNTKQPIIINNNKWNGLWQNEIIPINGNFIEVNDKIIVSLSNLSFTQLYRNNQNNQNNPQCIPNIFIGIGQLNISKTGFYITNVICNNYINDILGIGRSTQTSSTSVYFSGMLNNNNIILTPNITGSSQSITLTLKIDSNNNNIQSDYIKQISPFFTYIPNSPNTEYDYVFNCPVGTNKCHNRDNGLEQSNTYNACGTYNSYGSEDCSSSNVTCYINPPVNSDLPACTDYSINQSINYNAASYLMNSGGGNTLNVCSYLSNFSNSNCNSAILCYVSNVGDVKSLSYQFFGTRSNESSLTTQYDMMNKVLNQHPTTNLSKYRNIISSINSSTLPNDIINLQPILNSLSFTNCMINNNNIGITNNLITQCGTTCKQYVNNFNLSNGNNTLLPSIWNINFENNYNLVNSCGFELSTSQDSNTSIKYVNCNDDGTINLSLYKGGLNQKLYLENITILYSTNSSQYPSPNIVPIGSSATSTAPPPSNNLQPPQPSPSIIITANIRANNGLYLIPDSGNSGFSNNSTIIKLQQNPEPNSKWLILGFSLNSLDDLQTKIESFNF